MSHTSDHLEPDGGQFVVSGALDLCEVIDGVDDVNAVPGSEALHHHGNDPSPFDDRELVASYIRIRFEVNVERKIVRTLASALEHGYHSTR